MKIPKARKLPSGSWSVQLRLDGESIRITRPTEAEAVRAAELVKAQYRNGLRVEKRTEATLRSAIDKYVATRSNVLSPATIRGYRIIQRNRFQSVMDRPLSAKTNWQAVVNAEARTCSAKTLKNAYLFIASVLRENGVDAPSVKLPQVVGETHAYLDPEQIRLFLKAVEGAECEMAALLALHSLRRSELLALEKSSICGGIIRVRGAVVPNEENRLIKKAANKNTASSRNIPVMMPRLAALVDQAQDGPLVTIHPDTLRKHINRVCTSAGLPEVGIHGLRHSFASLAYHLGLSEREAMEIGGWADQTTMRKIYTHISQQDKEKAANKMTEFYSSLQ